MRDTAELSNQHSTTTSLPTSVTISDPVLGSQVITRHREQKGRWADLPIHPSLIIVINNKNHPAKKREQKVKSSEGIVEKKKQTIRRNSHVNGDSRTRVPCSSSGKKRRKEKQKMQSFQFAPTVMMCGVRK